MVRYAAPLQDCTVCCDSGRNITRPVCAGFGTTRLCHRALACQRSYVNLGLYDGGLNFNGSVPVTGATGRYSVPVFSYYHSLSFFGRYANMTASLPYAVETFKGTVLGNEKSAYRSGLLDLAVRLSVNLRGGEPWRWMSFKNGGKKTFLA